MPEPTYYALWDVDGNLVNSYRGREYLNRELLLAYSLLGVKAGVFFTSYDRAGMKVIASFPEERRPLSLRNVLKTEVENLGFTVEAVVTGRDWWYAKHLKKDFHYPGLIAPKQPSAEYYRVGQYYQERILRLEELYLTQTEDERTSACDPHGVFGVACSEETRLNAMILSKEPSDKTFENPADDVEYFSNMAGHKNQKYYMFIQVIRCLGEGDLTVGAQRVRDRNQYFVFSDDKPEYLQAVKNAAALPGIQLQDRLLIINTSEGNKLSATDYLKQLGDQLPGDLISRIIDRQKQLTRKPNASNNFPLAMQLSYSAFKRAAIKSGVKKKRRSRQGLMTYTSTTFKEELGERICLRWSLHFLKLAWLFRKDPYGYVSQPRRNLRQEIFLKRLYEIYQTQQRITGNQGGPYDPVFKVDPQAPIFAAQTDGGQTIADASDQLIKFTQLEDQTRNSQWRPLLNLADSIDEIILSSQDWVACFRLGLYYAVLDAANQTYQVGSTSKSHFVTIKACFDKVSGLMLAKVPIDKRIKFESLKAEILTRQDMVSPHCRLFRRRCVVIHSFYESDQKYISKTQLFASPEGRGQGWSALDTSPDRLVGRSLPSTLAPTAAARRLTFEDETCASPSGLQFITARTGSPGIEPADSTDALARFADEEDMYGELNTAITEWDV